MRCAFVHPDLGIGGAERLILDQALALDKLGHSVDIFTTSYDRGRCFEASKQFRVTVVGQRLPRTVLGFGYIAICWLRMFLVGLYIMLNHVYYDVIFVDQVSPLVPFLGLWCKHIVFYCHFPDQLMADRKSVMRRLYRMPFDILEGLTMTKANVLLCNSHFTKTTMQKTFSAPLWLRRFADYSCFDKVRVLYPCVHLKQGLTESDEEEGKSDDFHFVSINRYERKKGIELAINAAARLRDMCKDIPFRMTVAGGYDDRLLENVEYYKELKVLADELNFPVRFIKSITDGEKDKLIRSSDCLIYTPINEHLGIGPLEAMACAKAVIAVNSGGPAETVVDGQTGYLLKPDPDEFARHMKLLLKDRQSCRIMGNRGLERVKEEFSFEHFTSKMEQVLDGMKEMQPLSS